MREDVNVFRQRPGLPPANRSTARRLAERGAYTVHAFSSRLVPQPLDRGPSMPVVGSIRFPAEARDRLGEAKPDPKLAAWLRNGEPPIYFGLGSMPVSDPSEMLGIIESVARKRGERAIVVAGWSSLAAAKNLPDHLRVVGAVDHGRLFPQCGGAVHHGGAGTVFAAASAGLPSVVCSVFADQPLWGARLERLGVGVHLPFKNASTDSLSVPPSRRLCGIRRAVLATYFKLLSKAAHACGTPESTDLLPGITAQPPFSTNAACSHVKWTPFAGPQGFGLKV